MRNKEEIVVVTVRCIDMAARCADVDKVKCSDCGEMTWLSPSWRGRNIDRIVCEPCFSKVKYGNDGCKAYITKRCLNDALEELKNILHLEGGDDDIKKEMIYLMERRMGKKIEVTD